MKENFHHSYSDIVDSAVTTNVHYHTTRLVTDRTL